MLWIILKQLWCFWTFPSSISVVCSNMQEALIFVVIKVLGLFSTVIRTLMWHAFWSTGSLLIGRTDAESDVLKGRVKLLCEAGLKAEYLCSSDLIKEEPDLLVDKDSAAAFLPDDCQIDAYRTVAYIEKVLYSWFIFLCISFTCNL